MVLGRKISVERVLRVCADNSVFRNNVNQCGVKISKFIYHYAPEHVDKQKYTIPWYRANFGFLDCQPHILISSGIVNIRFCAQNLSTKLMLLFVYLAVLKSGLTFVLASIWTRKMRSHTQSQTPPCIGTVESDPVAHSDMGWRVSSSRLISRVHSNMVELVKHRLVSCSRLILSRPCCKKRLILKI